MIGSMFVGQKLMWTSANVSFLLSVVALGVMATPPRSKFKAAVYGHAVILPENPTTVVSRDEALINMKKNIDVYRSQAAVAKLQGADILVFPEDGLYGFTFTRESIYPYLETIPDPRLETWSPCSDPHRHSDTDILRALSCIAKHSSLYLVANMGDKQPCDASTEPKCPKDGRYQFNTNVAFGPDGTLLARYHKFHLFFEPQFDTPDLELVHFDTPFGRFGMLVCFDVLFKEPGVPMVTENNISNIVFPTAWMDALPLLSALGFHSSFARGLGVNFLSADIHLPGSRFHGSGIYSPNGAEAFYYGAKNTSLPKLLVAELDVLDTPKHEVDILDLMSAKGQRRHEPSARYHENMLSHGESMRGKGNEDKVWAVNKDANEEFTSLLFYDQFTFVALNEPAGTLKVCQKEVCCKLEYAIEERDYKKELFAFGAFDGLHTYEGQYYFQICTVVKCDSAFDRSTCGAETTTSSTHFLKLKMSAHLGTPFVYPQIVLSDHRGELHLAEPGAWTFTESVLRTSPSFNGTLLSAALFGRDYGRDDGTTKEGDDVDEDSSRDVNVIGETTGERNDSAKVSYIISIVTSLFGLVHAGLSVLFGV
ncbi:unnamed protein product [Lymnaea stagnalis]|uniref:CN hydrolase domain-containing protein n=1 Tax=Lymnaea stagnalis TaxID=6523 RepID=A0AAV2HBM7_LYMST